MYWLARSGLQKFLWAELPTSEGLSFWYSWLGTGKKKIRRPSSNEIYGPVIRTFYNVLFCPFFFFCPLPNLRAVSFIFFHIYPCHNISISPFFPSVYINLLSLFSVEPNAFHAQMDFYFAFPTSFPDTRRRRVQKAAIVPHCRQKIPRAPPLPRRPIHREGWQRNPSN